jgi:hypothetical protein
MARARIDALSAGAAALVAAPIVIDLWVSGRGRVFGYLAADAFYYLTVGRNFADHGALAYDQTRPTNGYHPLWQIFVAALFSFARATRLPDTAVLVIVVLAGSLLLAACVVLIVLASRRAGSPIGAGMTSLPVGAYALATLPFWIFGGTATRLRLEGDAPLFGTLWSYANGMESALLLALFGVVCLRFAGQPARDLRTGAWTGALLGLLTLTRLDHGVFAVAFLLLLAWDHPRRSVWLIATTTWLSLLGAYLALNHFLVGEAFPVSGALKSTFPRVAAGNFQALKELLSNPPENWFPNAIRMTQMLFPAIVAAAFLTSHARGDRWGRILRAWSAAVLALAAYRFLYVPSHYQWHWYYPASTLFVGVLGAHALDRLCSWRPRWKRGIVLATFAISIATFLMWHRRPDYHANYAAFYFEEAPRLRRHFAGRAPRLLEYDDGVVAFSTGFRAMNGLGLAVDPEAARAHREGRLLELALERGHDHLTTLVYGGAAADSVASGERGAAARYAARLAGREARRFAFARAATGEGSLVMVRFAAPDAVGTAREADPTAPRRLPDDDSPPAEGERLRRP